MNDKIDQEITINAPITTVWKVITSPEHMTKWFSDRAEIDLKKGGKGKLTWDSMGDAPLEVIDLDEPTHFAFAWVAPDEETKSTNQQTLVEFRLAEDTGSTKLHLTESIYDGLKLTNEQKNTIFEKHTSGWNYFAEKIKQQAEAL